MISERQQFYLLHLTLEAKSAHGMFTGFGDMTHDHLIFRDANQLPTLPGSSLAGVLRHRYAQRFGKEQAEALFGYADGDEGQSSWLQVMWGLVHDSNNQPVQGLKSPDAVLADPLLFELSDDKPIVRQRVRLNEYGATDKSGKFDVTLVPSGARYSTWIQYWSDGSEGSKLIWELFVGQLQSEPLRLGHATRSGYGEFEVIGLHQGHWDLGTEAGRNGFLNRPRQRGDVTGLTDILPKQSQSQAVTANLSLSAEGGWRVGGGERYLGEDRDDRSPALLPMHERQIEWKNNHGRLGEHQYLLPGTAIKGALRHRLAYHYNCLTQQFADQGTACCAEDNLAVKTLFGYTSGEDAHAGLLVFKDVYLPSNHSSHIQMHNKIDRYTGGVMKGALFSEQVLYQGNITVSIEVLPSKDEVDGKIKQALALTLQDLAQGWLSLGGSGSRGLGTFSAHNFDTMWSDSGAWMAQGEA